MNTNHRQPIHKLRLLGWSLALILLVLTFGCPAPSVGDCNGDCKDSEECVQDKFCLPKCESTETRCASKCIDTKTDKTHCGTCDNACKDGKICNEGKCQAGPECKDDETACGSDCADTKTDKAHCGKCDNACKDSEECKEGKCQEASKCNEGETDCNGTCVDTTTDDTHCGKCDNKCGTDMLCNTGTCECKSGQTDCNGKCVDLESSDAHCGKCDNKCTSPQYCDVGQCVCGSGQSACGGKCVETDSSNDHCGKCDNKCSGGSTCISGSCECSSGKELCSDKCVDTAIDKDNCGSCGNACPSGESCKAGKCEGGTTTCTAPQVDCNGTCTNTNTDDKNCGTCGKTCPSGESCDSGTCKSGCAAPKKSCNGTCTDLQNDKNNCGTCGNTCNASESCVSGTCSTTCTSPKKICNGTCTDLQTDDKNCGTCGKTCSSGESCTSGTCSAACTSPKKICSGACTDLQTDDKNCGTCGKTCPSGESCTSGSCIAGCAAPKKVCNGTCTNTNTDKNNCGSCGNTCSGVGVVCFNGTCKSTWLGVVSGNKSTRIDAVTANSMGNVYSTGSQPRNDNAANLFLHKHDNTGTATSLSVVHGSIESVHVDLNGDKTFTTKGWSQIKGWRTGSAGLYQTGGAFNKTSGEFTAPKDGYYIFNAGLTFLSANAGGGYISVSITINATPSTLSAAGSGMYNTLEQPSDIQKLAVQGLVKLSKGDKATVWAYTSTDSSYKIRTGSFFSGHYVGQTLAHGFHADLKGEVQIKSIKGGSIGNWQTTGAAGLFSNGGGFNAANGEFTAPETGYYYFSSQVFFLNNHDSDPLRSGAQGTTLEAWLSINGIVGNTNGLYQRVVGNVRKRITLTPAGTVYLTKGDKVKLYSKANAVLTLKRIPLKFVKGSRINTASGFSGVYLGAFLHQGFNAELIVSSQAIKTTQPVRIKGFRTSGVKGLFSTGGGFNAANGEFTAGEEGYYLFNAQAIFNYANASSTSGEIRLFWAINGKRDAGNGSHIAQRTSRTVATLQFSTILHLKKGDKVSLEAQATKDNNYLIGGATGISGRFLEFKFVNIQGSSITTDKNDNVFVSGQIQGAFQFGNTKHQGSNNTFIGKRASDGSWSWVRNYATSLNPETSLQVDTNGNLYLCGNYSKSWTYATGKTLPTPTGGQDGFIAKLNSTGSPQWALAIKSSTKDSHLAKCSTTPTGSVYISGRHRGKTTFGTITLNGGGSTTNYYYLARTKTDGSGFGWAKEFGRTATITGLTSDSKENVYIIGAFNKTLTLGSTKLTSTGTEIFVMALDKTGKVLWTQQTKVTSGNAAGGQIKLVGTNIYFSGQFDGKITAGTSNVSTNGKLDFFLGTLDRTTGKWLSAKSAGSTENETNMKLATDGSNLYMSGAFFSKSVVFDVLTATKKQTSATFYDSVITKNLP